MIDSDTQFMPIAIPIAATDRRQAYQFAKQQPTPAQAEQVYRNTLAVLVTQHYFRLLGIDTDPTASLSWNPLERLLEDMADLYIPDLKGFLECRSVRQSDRKCSIPPEVWEDRVGYVVIQLDEPYQEGYILGFIESISVPELPLSYLQPITNLIDQFLEQPPQQPIVRLKQWLKRQFEPDWHPKEMVLKLDAFKNSTLQLSLKRTNDVVREWVEQLYRQQSRSQPIPATMDSLDALVHLIQTAEEDEVRWNCAELLWKLDPHHPKCPIINAKDLGFYLAGQTLVLMVGLLPKPDGTFLILLRVFPIGQLLHLPSGLKLIGSDETNIPFFEVESRQRDDYMQFKFTADEGDRFSVRVVLDDASFTESFVI